MDHEAAFTFTSGRRAARFRGGERATPSDSLSLPDSVLSILDLQFSADRKWLAFEEMLQVSTICRSASSLSMLELAKPDACSRRLPGASHVPCGLGHPPEIMCWSGVWYVILAAPETFSSR